MKQILLNDKDDTFDKIDGVENVNAVDDRVDVDDDDDEFSNFEKSFQCIIKLREVGQDMSEESRRILAQQFSFLMESE